jgi:long-chain acyl-CoA synthetase
MNLANLMIETAEEHGDRIAIKLDDVELTYSALDGASKHIAGLLAADGVEAGDRVGIMLPNVPYFPVIYYGALRLGAVVVPMNPLLKGREVEFYLSDNGAKVLFAWHGFEEPASKGADAAGAKLYLVEPGEFEKTVGGAEPEDGVADRDEDDTAVLLYTSGTTGKPKGAELTHANLTANAKAARGLFDTDEDDIVLGALPLFHSFGQTCGLNATMAGGGMITLIPRFDPDKALEIIDRDKVTIFEGVPTMFSAMLHAEAEHDVSTLKLCASGGSAMPGEVLRGFEDKFGCKVLEGYGLSETSPVATFNHPDKERKIGSIGTPIEGVELRLVDDDRNEVSGEDEIGEIAIRGHNIMKGYWDREEATAEAIDDDGWFYTGDMAKRDDEGYYFIVDRKKELIIRGGYNVYPREIEEVLYEHAAVKEAAVVGVPHDELGEEIGAAVVLKDGEDASEDDLREHVKNEVAAYKYPRKIWFVDELPKGPTGKILKREIEVPSEISK